MNVHSETSSVIDVDVQLLKFEIEKITSRQEIPMQVFLNDCKLTLKQDHLDWMIMDMVSYITKKDHMDSHVESVVKSSHVEVPATWYDHLLKDIQELLYAWIS